MGITRLPLLFRGTKNDKYIYTLFDSGVNYLFLRKNIAEQLEDLMVLNKPLKMANADSGIFFKCTLCHVHFFLLLMM